MVQEQVKPVQEGRAGEQVRLAIFVGVTAAKWARRRGGGGGANRDTVHLALQRERRHAARISTAGRREEKCMYDPTKASRTSGSHTAARRRSARTASPYRASATGRRYVVALRRVEWSVSGKWGSAQWRK